MSCSVSDDLTAVWEYEFVEATKMSRTVTAANDDVRGRAKQELTQFLNASELYLLFVL